MEKKLKRVLELRYINTFHIGFKRVSNMTLLINNIVVLFKISVQILKWESFCELNRGATNMQ